MATLIEKVECWVFRAPIAEPVANAFGAMTNRPAVFLRVAASATDGYAEVDANPNPPREEVFRFMVVDGWVTLSDAPGLGVEPDLSRLAKYLVVRSPQLKGK